MPSLLVPKMVSGLLSFTVAAAAQAATSTQEKDAYDPEMDRAYAAAIHTDAETHTRQTGKTPLQARSIMLFETLKSTVEHHEDIPLARTCASLRAIQNVGQDTAKKATLELDFMSAALANQSAITASGWHYALDCAYKPDAEQTVPGRNLYLQPVL